MKENQKASTVRKIITVCSYPFQDKQTIYHGATRMINEKARRKYSMGNLIETFKILNHVQI